MDKTKCPICSGDIVLEYCIKCGYRVPNEKEISSSYNYEPNDYLPPNYEDRISPEVSSPDYNNLATNFEDIKTPEINIPANDLAFDSFEDIKTPEIDIPKPPEPKYSVPPIEPQIKTSYIGEMPAYKEDISANKSPYVMPNSSENVSKNHEFANKSYKPYTQNPNAPIKRAPFFNQSEQNDGDSIIHFVVSEWIKLIFVLFFGTLGIIWGFILHKIYRKKARDGEPKYSKFATYLMAIIILRIIIEGLIQM